MTAARRLPRTMTANDVAEAARIPLSIHVNRMTTKREQALTANDVAAALQLPVGRAFALMADMRDVSGRVTVTSYLAWQNRVTIHPKPKVAMVPTDHPPAFLPFKPTDVAGVVYFVRSGGAEPRIKIGFSEYLPRRVSGLRLGSPVPVRLIASIPGSRSTEQYIHRLFVADRTHGEWFMVSPELRAFIRKIRRPEGREYGPGWPPER